MDELTTPTQSAGSTSQNPIQPLVDAPLTETPVPAVTPEPTITQATPQATPVTPAVEPQVAATPESTTVATQAPTTSSSEQPQNAFVQMLMENKKVVAIGVVAVVAVVIGLSVLIGAKSSSEYQGLIKRIDSQTQELNKASQTNISSPSATDVDPSTIDNSIPFEMEGTPAASEEPSTAKIAR